MLKKSSTFEVEKCVTPHMTDPKGTCRAGETLRFMQEAAFDQLETLGPSLGELAKENRAFLVSRISVDFLEPLRYGDELISATYPCASSHGLIYDRNYELRRKDNNTLVARAVSQWAMVDTKEKKLVRVEERGIPYSEDKKVETTLPVRFRIPKTVEMETVGTRTVRYCDCDSNDHLNNTRYVDICTDFMPDEILLKNRVTAVAVSFQHEAPRGVTLTVKRGYDAQGDMWYFRTTLPTDEVNMEAVLKIAPVSP